MGWNNIMDEPSHYIVTKGVNGRKEGRRYPSEHGVGWMGDTQVDDDENRE